MISIRRISLGGGFRYLMESVAVGDGAAEKSTPLERYYAESGTPPGRFLGSGLVDLGEGNGVERGEQVTEEHLYRMLVALADPVSGEPIGSSPKAPKGAAPVAGFDLTFSPPKSVSVAWALADPETKEVIYDRHLQAIDVILAYAEREVFHSRSGTNGIAEEDVTGVVAAAFTHWSSRSDDPQLHDHVVVWNRARSVSDGKWRTLDSKAIFKQTTTLSEMHQGVLSDLLTGELGVGWEARHRRHSAKPRYEITGVPEALMAEFSRRSDQIAVRTKRLREEFVAAHGRNPTRVEDMRLHQTATIATRPDKSPDSLAELTLRWHSRAARHIADGDQVAFVASLRNRNDLPLLRAGDLAAEILADAGRAVVATVSERHATFGRHNLLAEAHRVLHGVRFASPDDRIAVAERVADLAVDESLRLTPPELCHVPEHFRRPDGSSRFQPPSHIVYTTATLLEAEARLLEAARQLDGPRVAPSFAVAYGRTTLADRDHGLGADQALAVEKILASGRSVDVLVGPAGTGKTTAMAGLRAAWETVHGPASVVGLAPSAAAAQALGDELGIDTENTVKWLTEWRRVPALSERRRRLALNLARHAHPASLHASRLRAELRDLDRAIAERRLSAGQLMIVDEASLAGTFQLDELVSAATGAGAKVVLVGDWAQLGSIEAGGAFSLLVRDRGAEVPELTDVRRFQADWEKEASIKLRRADPRAIDDYESHGRVFAGNRDALLDKVYAAWRADVAAGKSSLMLAGDLATVAELNRRARAGRVEIGVVSEVGVDLAGGQIAGVGDEVITRQNDRRLTTGKGWVRNGDRWSVSSVRADGSLSVRRLGGSGSVVLPAAYVAQDVELAYATTATRAQGRTVDTAHAMVSPATVREVLYVAATRGRESNILYVDTSYDPDPATGHDGAVARQAARDVLSEVLANEGSELSAHETLERAQRQADDPSRLAAEYETIIRVAQQERWDRVLRRSGLPAACVEEVRQSEAYGPLMVAFRRAEACGLDVEAALPRLVRMRSLEDANDIAALLHYRVGRWASMVVNGRSWPPARVIGGAVPRVIGITHPDVVRALTERQHAVHRGIPEHPAEEEPAHSHTAEIG